MPTALSDNRHWSAVLAHTMPRSAWARLVEIETGGGPFAGHASPWTAGGSWTVYAARALASIAVAVVSVRRATSDAAAAGQSHQKCQAGASTRPAA